MHKFLLFLLAPFFLLGQQDSLDNALLWKISKGEEITPSYLFGTIHIIPKEYYFLPKGTEEAIKDAKSITFEIDMDKMNDMSSIFTVMNNLMMDGDTTLSDLLSENQYNRVKDHFEKKGLPFMFFEKFKPMILSVLTSDDVSPENINSGKMMSYEQELAAIAKKYDVESEGLETIQFQIGLFDEIPNKAQAEMLYQAVVSEQSDSSNQMEFLYKAYRDQDLNALYQSFDDEGTGIGDYEDLLVESRNKNWIPLMTKKMDNGKHFFAVGAGHLPGKNGVIALLRKEGYTVEAINN